MMDSSIMAFRAIAGLVHITRFTVGTCLQFLTICKSSRYRDTNWLAIGGHESIKKKYCQVFIVKQGS